VSPELTREALAERAGVDLGYVDRLLDLGILATQRADHFAPGDLRRVRLLRGLEQGGLPLEGIATLVRDGSLSFDFLDLPSWDWFGGFVGKTYQEVSAETGVGFELIQAIRESMGFVPPAPADPVHEEVLEAVPVIKSTLVAGADAAALERLIRVWGESMRRIAEASSTFYKDQIVAPLLRAGMSEAQVLLAANEAVAAGIQYLDQAVIAMYHAHAQHTWMANVVEAVEVTLEKAGLHEVAPDPPAMSFVDLSDYTTVTSERGDEAAAEIAGTLGELVQRSVEGHGGRAIKWLGDGVMLYFAHPGDAVASALDLVERVPAAGLPPAHTGIDAGPVILQDGDYYGRTVNTAARIASEAGPGQVLVSERVVLASGDAAVRFDALGPVALKGLPEPIPLFRASRPA
jgi:adenylate cyclase